MEILTAGRDGRTMPKCLNCPLPKHSQEARRKKYQGVVILSVVVTVEAKAANIQVTKSPGMGLGEKAIESVRKWTFTPAMKDGKPVAAQAPVEVTFRLH